MQLQKSVAKALALARVNPKTIAVTVEIWLRQEQEQSSMAGCIDSLVTSTTTQWRMHNRFKSTWTVQCSWPCSGVCSDDQKTGKVGLRGLEGMIQARRSGRPLQLGANEMGRD